jgi:K+/H+ antiporter YhaU regulatory subunit KhtT
VFPIIGTQVSVNVARMAETAAAIGLVASIASLIDLSAKVVSRLHEFTSKTSDIPESFRSLSIQLPLLTATLQHIQAQAQAGRFPDDATKALKAVVDSTFKQVSDVQTCLSHILPLDSASKVERALKALKSLAKEDKVRQALEKIHKNIGVLVLHQTTRHVDTGNLILEELSKLSVAPSASSKSYGLCLGQAPQIEPDAFIGRINELQQLQDWLLPTNHPHRQCIVSIVGMGGMGKTQLSLAHVRNCVDDYSSVFWVNAKDETSLRQNMADLSAVIFHGPAAPAAQSADDEKLKIDKVRRWLSEPGNDQWLLIFDNYDDPHLPGIRSPTGYNIQSFFPTRSQGSIIITSRSTKLTFSKQLKLQNLENVHTSVAILSQRSGRDLSHGETQSELDILQYCTDFIR